jgi:DNA mismatch endonuclease Vsr
VNSHKLTKPTPERGALMGRVRQKGTTPELSVSAALRRVSLQYRKSVRDLPGSPDFANKSSRWAVFVNGCFWHQHRGCRRATIPMNNRAFWMEKFERNRERDAQAIRALRQLGYKVVVVWECQALACEQRLSKILEPRRVNVGSPIDH